MQRFRLFFQLFSGTKKHGFTSVTRVFCTLGIEKTLRSPIDELDQKRRSSNPVLLRREFRYFIYRPKSSNNCSTWRGLER